MMRTQELLKLPIKLITWDKYCFTPENLSPQFALVNPECQQAISTGQLMLASHSIEIPKETPRMLSEESVSWMQQQLFESWNSIKTEPTKILRQNENNDKQPKKVIKQAVFYRNLLIAITRKINQSEYSINAQYIEYPL